jgi:signal transduction histidine kinase
MDPEYSDEHSDASAIRNYPRLLHRYARLLEVTSDLASTLDLNELLQSIVNAARELTESDAASLLLYDPGTSQLYFDASSNLPGIVGVGRPAVPIENSIAGWVFSRQEPLIVHNALEDPRFFREIDILTRFSTQSILGVPLTAKDKTIGVIEAVNKQDGLFDEEDLRLLTTLAAQAAVAIENTRLFQQSDLVSEMVHELRTPLGALTAAAHLMQRESLPQEQKHHLAQTITEEARRLNEMATDFLELARLESGRVRLIREPVDLAGLIHETLEVVRPQADAEQLSLHTDVDRMVPPILGDRNRLKQLLLNLLTNAIKYNQPGGKISIRLARHDDRALLAVTDTGKGIPEESLTRIFERFYRVPDPSGAVAGAGLGLAIARRIAESHRGTIEVESRLGEGSTFTIHLPVGSGGGQDTRPVPG